MLKLVVPEGQDGESLANCIGDMLPEMKRSRIAGLLKKGDIRVNGTRTKKDMDIFEGDIIELYISDDMGAFLPRPEVVYEDDMMIIFNKPQGISSIADRRDGKPTMYDVAARYMKETGVYSVDTLSVPYICHRLDHFTGGLLIVAKSQAAYESLTQAIRQRRIRKYYRAIVVGDTGEEPVEIHDYLIKDAHNAKVKVVRAPSKEALPIVTRYRTEETNGDLSIVDIELVTGRTHQIRAHMAYVGHPVLGDDKYGNRRVNKKMGVRHQALWAYKLTFHTGRNNNMEYLDGLVVATDHIDLPYVDLIY